LTSVTDLAEPGNRGTEPEICNCAALRQAARHVTKLYDEALAPSGLGLNQYSILARLGRVGPSAIQDLARLLVMDRSTLGHLLRPLEARGLVTLEVSASDRRSRTIALTPAGAALVAETRPLWLEAQRRFESRFGAEAAGALRTVLKSVALTDFAHGDVAGAGSEPPDSGREPAARD
jgi:DNA-binding MarR family transcriptional regulator